MRRREFITLLNVRFWPIADESRNALFDQITIRSLPTTISPLKYFAAGARHVSSLMLSMAGVRCDNTSVLTPASCAMRPTSSEGVWSAFHVRHERFELDRPTFGDLT